MRHDDGSIHTPMGAGYALPGKIERDARTRRNDRLAKILVGGAVAGYLATIGAAVARGNHDLPLPTARQEGRTVLYLDRTYTRDEIQDIYRPQFEGQGPLVPDRKMDFATWYREFERVNGVEGKPLEKGFYVRPDTPRLLQR